MSEEKKKSDRLYYIDWLRVIAIFGLIMIHTAAMFDPYPFTAVKGRRSLPLILFSTFLHEWRLAILFIVSGVSSYFALGFLNARQFVSMRFNRIIIPLVVGTLLVVPVQLYLWQFFGRPEYNRTYAEFYVVIMRKFLQTGAFGRGRESLHWAHLWFLAYLFVNSLITLPLFLYLRGEKGQRFISRLAEFCQRRGAIFLFALPIIILEASLRARWFGSARMLIVDDLANFAFYLLLFIYGYIFFSDARLRDAFQRHRKVALLAGIVTSTLYLVIIFTGHMPAVRYSLNWTLYMVLRGFNAWFWCVTVFGFGARHLNFNHRFLPYANEAVYPVYILHLPIASIIARQVLRWNIGVAAQFLLITIGTVFVAVVIYDLLIRRTNVTRFLFGLKLKRRKRLDAAPVT